MADKITTSTKLASSQATKPPAAPAPPAAEQHSVATTTQKLAQDAAQFGEKTKTLIKENPGKTALAVAAVAATGFAIAKPEETKEVAKSAMKAVADNPVKAAAVVGVATYVASKHGGDIKEALKPENLENKIVLAEDYVKENPIKSAVGAAVLAWLGIKAVSKAVGHEESAESLHKQATFETVKELSTHTRNWGGVWEKFGETKGAIEKINTLMKPLAESGDPLAKQIASLAVTRDTLDYYQAKDYLEQNNETLEAIGILLEKNGY